MSDEDYYTGTERCFICSQKCPALLEEAHIVPNRMGGKDGAPNIVELCPTCHTAVDAIFDYDFFDRLFKHWEEEHKQE